MFDHLKEGLKAELNEIQSAGLYKEERVILSDQKPGIDVRFPESDPPRKVLNFCANNYLGLSNHPRLIKAAGEALDQYGFGLSSVRFICGTQDVHIRLEKRIAQFHGTDDTILYSSCFDANGGLFEPLLGADDAIVTDAFNHASIIDGIRLCRARRFIYSHSDMDSLEESLQKAAGKVSMDDEWRPARRILIVTDGVFSMDGDVARLGEIVELARKYRAMVMVDESHATGFFGKTGRGSMEYCGVSGEIDIITSTLGKAMGGASGGFTTGRQEIIDILRQKSRPYQFSNTLAPAIAGASIEAFNMLESMGELRETLEKNTMYFRSSMEAMGFHVVPGVHPIVPILFGSFPDDAMLSQKFARRLYEKGIFVVGFFFPVVPRGQARIRVQLSAIHTREQIDSALEAFRSTGLELGVIES